MPRLVAAWAVVAMLAAPSARAATRLAFLGVDGGAGVSADERATAEEVLLAALTDTGTFTVIGRADLRNLLGLEQAKQLLGCDDDSCLAELAGALGTGLVASARIGLLGRERIVTLKIIDAGKARVLVRVERTLGAGEPLADAMRDLAGEAVGRFRATLPGAGRRQLATAAFVTAGVAVTGAAVATFFVVNDWSAVQAHCVAATKECDATGVAAARHGAALEPWMDAGYALAVVAAATGTLLRFSGARLDASLALAPTDHGAALLVAGRF